MDPLERFEFSQSSLQDYVDCARRFELRYLLRVAWPAVQAEPARENERHMRRGERFHRLAQQYLLNLPVERLNRMAEADEDENLLNWWRNFLDCIPAELVGTRHVEVALEAPLGPHRLLAKYDLVLLKPGDPASGPRAVIYDWKTSLHRPTRRTLLERLQTRVYPYLLARAGAGLNQGCPIEPEQIEMVYWFADPSQPPEVIDYDRARCAADEDDLLGLVEAIRTAREFPQAETEKACRYCVYRSLCGRGIAAAELDGTTSYEPEEGENLNFDLEQIGEIGF